MSEPIDFYNATSTSISLDKKVSPTIFCDLLGINPKTFYELVAKGVFLSREVTYREGIQSYCKFLKTKASGKDANLMEDKIKSEIEVNKNRARKLKQDHDIQSGKLIDRKKLSSIFSTLALQMRTEMLALAITHPTLENDIVRTLEALVRMSDTLEKIEEEHVEIIDEDNLTEDSYEDEF